MHMNNPYPMLLGGKSQSIAVLKCVWMCYSFLEEVNLQYEMFLCFITLFYLESKSKNSALFSLQIKVKGAYRKYNPLQKIGG